MGDFHFSMIGWAAVLLAAGIFFLSLILRPLRAVLFSAISVIVIDRLLFRVSLVKLWYLDDISNFAKHYGDELPKDFTSLKSILLSSFVIGAILQEGLKILIIRGYILNTPYWTGRQVLIWSLLVGITYGTVDGVFAYSNDIDTEVAFRMLYPLILHATTSFCYSIIFLNMLLYPFEWHLLKKVYFTAMVFVAHALLRTLVIGNTVIGYMAFFTLCGSLLYLAARSLSNTLHNIDTWAKVD